MLVSRQVLEIGSSFAVLQYNHGVGGITNAMEKISVELGMSLHQGSIGKNDKRIKASTVKPSGTGEKKKKTT